MNASGPVRERFRPAAGAPSGALRRFLLALFLLVALPAAGAAHTRLESSDPAADAVLRTSPTEIRLRFTTPVEPGLTGATLVGAAGETVPLTATAEPGSGNRAFVLPLPAPLAPGQYLVEWRTAGGDGHVIQGAFSFLVEGLAPQPATTTPVDTAAPATVAPAVPHPAEAAQPGSPAESPPAVLVRWLYFLALLGLVGAAVLRLAVLPAAERGGLPAEAAGSMARRLHGVALGSLALFALALAGRLWVQAAALSGPDGAGGTLSTILASTTWGRAWVVQAAATACLLAALLYSGRGGTAGWRMAGAVAAVLAAATPFTGHAAGVERLRPVALLADALHVLGAGTWMGTLALLLAIGFPAALAAGEKGRGVAALFRAFTPVALLGAGTAAATGVVSALFHLGVPSELWGTEYGRVLLLKLALVAVAAAAGLRNWRTLIPALAGGGDADPLRRSVMLEVGAGVLVMLATAVLVALPTP